MKTKLILVLAVLALAFSGCATVTKDITTDITTVRDAFNSLLPSDFSGPVNLARTDMYATLTLQATNVHKGADGQWSWSTVDYRRVLSVPITPGLTWKSDVQIHLGDVNAAFAGGVGNPINSLPTVAPGSVTTSTDVIIAQPGTTTTTVTTAAKK